MFFKSLIYILIFSLIFCRSEDCTNENCLLPSCQCPISNSNPTPFKLKNLPQFIIFTFVGNLNRNTLSPLQSIFNSTHRNPNKCPITSTFFVHHVHTDYCLVQRVFDNQHEIAMTASNNKCPLTNCYNENQWRRWTNKTWKEEIQQQRVNLHQHGQIHQTHLKGFRVPHLQIDDNKHLEYLQQYHFHYDSSMLFKSSNLIWPFTLNYPINQSQCINCQRWTKAYDGLWQFPLHEWVHPNSSNMSTSCPTLHDPSCLPNDQQTASDFYFNLLVHNFERHISPSLGRRSPFIIQLDLSWLSHTKNQALHAVIRFIRHILTNPKYRYVYFISIEKALEWFKYPRSLQDLRDFWAFRCHDQIYDYDTDCSTIELNENLQEQISKIASLKSDNKSNSSDSQPVDRQAEKLFSSNIALHALWISLLLILIVIFYDKYFTNK